MKANSIADNWPPLGFFFDLVSGIGHDKDLDEVKQGREMRKYYIYRRRKEIVQSIETRNQLSFQFLDLSPACQSGWL